MPSSQRVKRKHRAAPLPLSALTSQRPDSFSGKQATHLLSAEEGIASAEPLPCPTSSNLLHSTLNYHNYHYSQPPQQRGQLSIYMFTVVHVWSRRTKDRTLLFFNFKTRSTIAFSCQVNVLGSKSVGLSSDKTNTGYILLLGPFSAALGEWGRGPVSAKIGGKLLSLTEVTI